MNHRKLISESETSNITSFCDSFCENTPGDCSALCYDNCPSYCPRVTIITVHHGSHKLLESLIISLSLIGLCCFIYCLLTLYKLYKNKRRPLQEGQETLDVDEFFDEEHGPILDHPIWYIRTVGLPSSTIDLITTIKYKRGEGLIEGTDCSVCLSEFEDDETLRLLPKCSHAFHLTCIDTWLRSHTNCPMCRAPILSNPNGALSPILEQNIEDDSVVENNQVVVSEGSEVRESENVDLESKGVESSLHVKGDNGDEEIGEAQAMKRSASMDLLAASKTMDLGNGLKRFMGSCSFKKSLQKEPISMKRSVSCSGKDLFLRHNQDMNLVLPA